MTPHDTTFKRASHNHMQTWNKSNSHRHHKISSITITCTATIIFWRQYMQIKDGSSTFFHPISSSLLYPPFSSPVKVGTLWGPRKVDLPWWPIGRRWSPNPWCLPSTVHQWWYPPPCWHRHILDQSTRSCFEPPGQSGGILLRSINTVWPLWHPLGSLQWSGLSYFGVNTQPQILPVKMDILYHSKPIFRTFSEIDWGQRKVMYLPFFPRHLFVPSKFAGQKFGGFFAVSLRTHLSLLNGLNQLCIQRFSLQVETVVLVCRLRQTCTGDAGDIPRSGGHPMNLCFVMDMMADDGWSGWKSLAKYLWSMVYGCFMDDIMGLSEKIVSLKFLQKSQEHHTEI